MIQFIWVASAWQCPLHYHALVYSAGTDSGLPYPPPPLRKHGLV